MPESTPAPAPGAGARTAVYAHGHHTSVLRSHRWRTAENSAAYLLPHLRPGTNLLDVGCGPGTITLDLAERVAPGDVVGIDPAPDVLETARAEATARGGAAGKARFVTGDITEPESSALPTGGFDVVHAHQVLQHLGDPVEALRAMRRLCRPDGMVAVRDADYAAMTWWPRPPALELWAALYRRVARAAGGEPDAGRRLWGWAREAGFTDITPSASSWCFAEPADREWWGGLWAERCTASGFARLAVTGGHATEEELAAIAAGWREWAAAEDGWFAVLHGEVLCRG
ncbi:methyltransferase domain-containing protein [Streptomyces sp. ST2-7A]|uniref:methyltransferase domain-containing protein n=1 Tax=Streptomyces sp. ST2-7A TaxID=2907214 RepID=UPI001F167663|nr:methyltransferase domain-containing protein [Streptomyces sp. ST2-7A]MCE7081639.1 methyltransferase domain-containing protein [Streptomyces sp. ST2-7A]